MLITALAWLYITSVCWLWGSVFFLALNKANRNQIFFPHFCIVCLTGLSLLSVIFGFLSLTIHLNGIYIQIGLFTATLLLFFIIRKKTFANKYLQLQSFHPIVLSLLLCSIFLVLVMSTWHITHPDTLIYHFPIIQSIAEHGLVTGLAQVHYKYGLNSSWFINCALFNFEFFNHTTLNFINTTVIAWFLLFVAYKIQICFFQKNRHNDPHISGLLWLMLLFLSFADYTHIRLTATSASPDFIVAVYLWLIFYLFYNEQQTEPILLLLFFLCILAVTVKLSAIAIVLLAVYTFYHLVKMRRIYYLLLPSVALIIIAPLLIRNIYTSGYAFYPAPFPDFANPAWKLSDSTVTNINKYILAYARTQVSGDEPVIVDNAIGMKWTTWMPVWWEQKSLVQKIILGSLPALLLLNILHLRHLTFFTKNKISVLLITCFAGLIIWFMRAPDPRFGIGYLLPLSSILLYNLFKIYLPEQMNRKVISGILICLSLLLLAYTGYRFVYFFRAENVLYPFGISLIK